MLNFEKLPKDGLTLHFVHIPLPPHTLSKSTPNCLAASNTLTPLLTIPLSPDGVKTTE